MENKKMKIIVCSKNKAKNQAVKNIVKKFIKEYEIEALETESGVSETPLGDNEGIQGCHNRIKNAIMQDNNGTLYIAMEGILSENDYGTFLCGWTVIYNKELNEYYYGCSSKIKIPSRILNEMNQNKRLSDVVASHTDYTEDEIRNYGTNGLLTNGEYTRTDEFMDSILCALSSKFKKI